MKRIINVVAAATLVLVTGCNKTEIAQDTFGTVLHASLEQSKTEFSDIDNGKYHVLWTKDDAINVNGATSAALEEGGSADVDFSFTETLSAPFNAVYPACAVSSVAGATANITLPAEQAYVANGYDSKAALMVAASNNESLAFHHLMAYVGVELNGQANIAAIEFASRKESIKVSGNFTTDYSTLTAVNGSQKVRITPEEAVALPANFTFVIPAQNYESGFEVRIFGNDLRSMSKVSTKAADIQAANYIPTVISYQPEEWPANLYLAGSAFTWGWDPTNVSAKLTQTETGVYKAENVAIVANQGFKVYGSTDWYPEYGVTPLSTNENIGIDFAALIGGDPQFKLSDFGYENGNYDITIDFNTKTVKFDAVQGGDNTPTYPTSLYMVGDATEWGWSITDSRAAMQNTSAGVFELKGIKLNTNNGFKFFEHIDWWPEYGMTTQSVKGALKLDLKDNIGGNDPQFYLSGLGYQSGYYNIKVSFVDMTVEVTSVDVIYLYGAAFADFTDWAYWVAVPGISENVYQIKGLNLNVGDAGYARGFKIYKAIEDWSNEYCMYTSSTHDDISFGHKNDAGDNQVIPFNLGYTSNGKYTVTINFSTYKITFEKE